MKDICLYCGGKILFRNVWQRERRYCSKSCAMKMKNRRRDHGLTISEHFEIFQHLVAVSNSPEEFYELYEKYFGGDDD